MVHVHGRVHRAGPWEDEAFELEMEEGMQLRKSGRAWTEWQDALDPSQQNQDWPKIFSDEHLFG